LNKSTSCRRINNCGVLAIFTAMLSFVSESVVSVLAPAAFPWRMDTLEERYDAAVQNGSDLPLSVQWGIALCSPFIF
jgi:hypothetical protein